MEIYIIEFNFGIHPTGACNFPSIDSINFRRDFLGQCIFTKYISRITLIQIFELDVLDDFGLIFFVCVYVCLSIGFPE